MSQEPVNLEAWIGGIIILAGPPLVGMMIGGWAMWEGRFFCFTIGAYYGAIAMWLGMRIKRR